MSDDNPWKISTVVTASGLSLRYAFAPPKQGPLRCCLVLLNGRNEFLEKYSYLRDDLQLPQGCGFLTWDHRGQGLSGGQTSHIDSFASFAEDARLILATALPAKLPYVILAHSMGALISLYAACLGYLQPEHLCLSAPFLGLPSKPLPTPFAKVLAVSLCALGLAKSYAGVQGQENCTRFADNQLTHSEARFIRMQAFGYPAKNVTYGWVRAALAAIVVVFKPRSLRSLRQLGCSVRILCPEFESIVAADAGERWVKLARQEGVAAEWFCIRGAKHELFSEEGEVYAASLAPIQALLTSWEAALAGHSA